MKTLEITVVRTYTTTIEVQVPSDTTTAGIHNAITGQNLENPCVDELHDEVWDCLAEQELEQMNTDLLNYEIKEL